MRQGLHNKMAKGLKLISYGALLLLLSMMMGCAESENEAEVSLIEAYSVILPEAGIEEAAFVISTNGGEGGAGVGGMGGAAGAITITLNNAKAGRLEVLDNGLANASFILSSATVNIGDNPLTIGASQTISVGATKPASGVPYMVDDDVNLYLATSSTNFPDVNERVTGLSVMAGFVLTLELNASANTVAALEFFNDVNNEGTIQTADAAGGMRGGLSLVMKNYYATGAIVTSGTSTTVMHAGDIKLVTDNDLINTGMVEAIGFSEFAGETGSSTGVAGNAGSIDLIAVAALENSAIIDASGGATNAGGFDAGNGGDVTLNSNFGHLYNSGAIISVGGNGDGKGGDAGDVKIDVTSTRIGTVINSGAVDASGGVSTTGDGGNAGAIVLRSIGGALTNNAALMANGGHAANDFNAGNAGNIKISTEWGDFETPPGHLIISGDITAMGGSAVGTLGGVGGSAGSVTIIGNDGIALQQKQLLGLWGYTNITTKGGSAETPANGKPVQLTVASLGAVYPNNWELSPVGSLINEVGINTSGGTTSSADGGGSFTGGAGAAVFIKVQSNIIGDTSTLNNSGMITTVTGNNQNSNSQVNSGNVNLEAPGGVTNSAAINSQGGIDTSVANAGLANETSLVARVGNAKANHAGYIFITSSAGNIMNSGSLTANGGDAEVAGGDAGNINIVGLMINNSADISASGGSSTVLSLFNSKGGDAALVYLRSKMSGGITNTGTITNDAGVGEVLGEGNRQHIIDGL